jgi:hypothetical protein
MSVRSAIVIACLEETLGVDPFSDPEGTFGPLVKFYEHAAT